MGESKHTFTPGPWAIRRGHSTVEITTVAGLRLAQTTTDPYWQAFSAESEANARLIAVAPDLLAMLKHAVHWHDQLSAKDIARYETVIAAAEGK